MKKLELLDRFFTNSYVFQKIYSSELTGELFCDIIGKIKSIKVDKITVALTDDTDSLSIPHLGNVYYYLTYPNLERIRLKIKLKNKDIENAPVIITFDNIYHKVYFTSFNENNINTMVKEINSLLKLY